MISEAVEHQSLIYSEQVSEGFLLDIYGSIVAGERRRRRLDLAVGSQFSFSIPIFLYFGYDQPVAFFVILIIAFVMAISFTDAKASSVMMGRSSFPVSIYEDGICIYASPDQRRHGFDGFIRFDQIETVYKRTTINEDTEWFVKQIFVRPGFNEIRLSRENKLLELVIRTKDGAVYHSGIKPSSLIKKIHAEIMSRSKPKGRE